MPFHNCDHCGKPDDCHYKDVDGKTLLLCEVCFDVAEDYDDTEDENDDG